MLGRLRVFTHWYVPGRIDLDPAEGLVQVDVPVYAWVSVTRHRKEVTC